MKKKKAKTSDNKITVDDIIFMLTNIKDEQETINLNHDVVRLIVGETKYRYLLENVPEKLWNRFIQEDFDKAIKSLKENKNEKEK